MFRYDDGFAYNFRHVKLIKTHVLLRANPRGKKLRRIQEIDVFKGKRRVVEKGIDYRNVKDSKILMGIYQVVLKVEKELVRSRSVTRVRNIFIRVPCTM